MAITKDELKELAGKRITIDGVRHRVERTVLKTGAIITRDGVEIDAEGVYKRGPGFFYDSPTKGKKKPAATADAKPTSRRKPKEDEPVKETARQRRAREKLEAELEDKVKQKVASTGSKTKQARKKKLFEAFEQAIAERISQESFDLLTAAYADKGEYAITPVAVGASFDDNALKIVITVMPAAKTAKDIKNYIRDHRESTDIASDDEEDDDLEDEDLADDDNEDEDLEDGDEEALLIQLNALSLKDLRKIAKHMEIDDYRDFDKESLAQELSEYEESDVRESAASVKIELVGDDDEEEDEDLDGDLEDDEEDEEEDSGDATVEDLVGEIVAAGATLKEAAITKFVEAFLANDEISEKFDGELVPGRAKLQEKGGKGPEMLLIGYDEEGEAIKLLNLTTMKTRSKTIGEVVHMEVLEDADE